MEYISDILPEEFLKPYMSKKPKWGYNGLGEIVYKRTYSRIKEDGTNEEWWETVARCINGAQKIGADYTTKEAQQLYDYIFNLKCNFAGRMLWQLGTSTVDRFGANSLLNCLAGETNVLTRDGWKEISSLEGKTVEVVTKNGKWVDAPFKSYGEQKLFKIDFEGKYSNKSTIYATEEHRWYVQDRSGNPSVVTTKELLDELYYVPLVRGKNSSKTLSPQGIQHGLVYGDGSVNSAKCESIIDLFENTLIYCRKYFELNPSYDLKNGGVRYRALPIRWKEFPDIRESKQYLMGFLAGWIAADGCVKKSDGSIRLFNKDKSTLKRAKDIASVCGFRTTKPYLERNHNPFTGEKGNHELWSITFCAYDKPRILLVRDDHIEKHKDTNSYYNSMKVVSVKETDRVEKVYCAEVPETHSFVINDNILTGNCWGVCIRDIDDFCFIFENLMLGGGVGFSIRKEDVHDLPRVKEDVTVTHKKTNDADFIVPDTREGWVKLLKKVLKSFFYTGESFTYSTILVRSGGEPIRGFGGKASGPGILIEGIEKICGVIKERESKKLRSIDVLDICNIIGSVVVAGNVRRSAEIAVGDPDDYLFLRAKRWDLGNVPNWRAMSNNTIYADSYDHISDAVWKGYDGSGEPYGFFNLPLAQKYGRLQDKNKDKCEIVNPCAEILLESHECCNLSEIYLNNIETKTELKKCAKLLYKAQKAICALPFIHKKTEDVVHKNMRIGVGVTGICQSLDKLDWLDSCYNALKEYDEEWSEKKGYPASIRLTTVKPSGTLSLLSGSTPGVHPAYANYFIRRVRMSSDDALVDICRDANYPIEYVKRFDGTEDHSTVVIEFPCHINGRTILAKDMTAIRQLELVKELQTKWSDNSVSVTVYYKLEELDEIKEWMEKNYASSLKTVSFLLHSDHGFEQAPYEEITQEEYEKRVAKLKPIENVENGEVLKELECVSGSCPIR